MFGFKFLTGDAVAAVLTYSSTSSTALLSYQPGAKVPARGKVGRGLTRSSATLALDSRMCIIGRMGDTRHAEKLAAGAFLAEALKTRRWHMGNERGGCSATAAPQSVVQWSYVCMDGLGLAHAANDVLQCARCRHARLHAR